MNSPQNNENPGYSNLAERHYRRSGTTTVASGKQTSSRRRGLPEDYQREAEEQEYQARYENQLRERRQQRATERRETRQREILSGRVEKRPRRNPSSEVTWRWVKISLTALIALILLVASVMAYDKLTGSQLFVLKEIELKGTRRVSREEMLHLLNSYKSHSLWQLDLQAIRGAIEKNPWVLEAEVSRVLPDSLRVTIHEREPIAPWRTSNNSVVWVDREGRSLGELSLNQTDQIPPVINGLEEGTSPEIKAANQQRMETYQKLLAEIDQNGSKLSEEIDEVNLQDLQVVKIHLMKRNVTVLLGKSDFRPKLERSLRILEKIEQKEISSLGFLNHSDAERLVNGDRIAYLNVTLPDRVIIGFANNNSSPKEVN